MYTKQTVSRSIMVAVVCIWLVLLLGFCAQEANAQSLSEYGPSDRVAQLGFVDHVFEFDTSNQNWSVWAQLNRPMTSAEESQSVYSAARDGSPWSPYAYQATLFYKDGYSSDTGMVRIEDEERYNSEFGLVNIIPSDWLDSWDFTPDMVSKVEIVFMSRYTSRGVYWHTSTYVHGAVGSSN